MTSFGRGIEWVAQGSPTTYYLLGPVAQSQALRRVDVGADVDADVDGGVNGPCC
jgi:hypothetical protein